MLETGERLGRYLILDYLGGGGLGSVYLAEDTVLDARIALKLLNADVGDLEETRFKREIVLSRRISHPGVCRMYDLHERDGRLYLTMEYIAGDTLERVLKKQRILDVARAVRIVRDACEAVGAAHDAGILHRDLKPGNIMLGLGRKPTILDFGCATASSLSRLTGHGAVVGTVRYIAPELLNGADASMRSDVYALGIILYRCLTGRYPFTAETFDGYIKQARTLTPDRVSQFNENVNPELDEVIATVLSSDPAHRYASTAEFSQALRRALEPTLREFLLPQSGGERPWDRDVEKTVTHIVTAMHARNDRVEHRSVLFSDIAGIRDFFETHGAALGSMQIRRHNELLLQILREWGGAVIAVMGDAIIASFASPNDAVNAAIGFQRSWVNLRDNYDAIDSTGTRIGIHTSEQPIAHGDMFGEAATIAARIAECAEKDQVLISQEAYLDLLDSPLAIPEYKRTALQGQGDREFRLYKVQWAKLADKAPQTDIEDTPRDVPPVAQRPAHPPRRSALLETQAPKSFAQRAKAVRREHTLNADLKQDPQSAPSAEDWQHRCDELCAEIAVIRQQKGIIDGDDANIDRLMDTAGRQMESLHFEQGARFYELVLIRMTELAIDRVFVAGKLGRLDQRVGTTVDPDVSEARTTIRNHFSAQKFAEANRLINDLVAKL